MGDKVVFVEEILHQVGSLSPDLQGLGYIPGGCLGFLPTVFLCFVCILILFKISRHQAMVGVRFMLSNGYSRHVRSGNPFDSPNRSTKEPWIISTNCSTNFRKVGEV